MLDAHTIAVIKSTIPAIVTTGPTLTAHFYDRMFRHNPELKEVFNMSNQRNGDQREALFNALCAYASNIDNLAALLPAVEKIAQKHTSFAIQPEQYAIVGHHLLETLRELLNPAEEVIEAWDKAYGVLASVFIQREEAIYQASEQQHGGWRGTRPFRIAKICCESRVIKSIELEPVDGKPLAAYQPGQYLGLWLKPAGFAHQEIRQYSLTRSSAADSYRIAVKQEPQGSVSGWLHQHAREGDVVQLAPPAGDFSLQVDHATPVALISAGVGQTPLLAMLHTLADRGHSAPVVWLHSATNGATHAFAAEVAQLGSRLDHFSSRVWYSQPQQQDNSVFHPGRMVVAENAALLDSKEMQFYLCGPVGFMQSVAQQLTALGVTASQLHYEVFGPHKVL